MAGMIREDFRVIFEIITIGSIKAWKESKIDGVTHKPFVKFRTVNTEEKMDADVGIREIETIIDFQIHVDTLQDAVLLTEKIRKMRADHQMVYISGGLPRKEGADDILTVKSTESYEAFQKRNKITLVQSKEVK